MEVFASFPGLCTGPGQEYFPVPIRLGHDPIPSNNEAACRRTEWVAIGSPMAPHIRKSYRLRHTGWTTIPSRRYVITAVTNGSCMYAVVFTSRAFSPFATVAGRDFYSHRLGAKRKSSALGLL